MSKIETFYEKVEKAMDRLQDVMERNRHLDGQEGAEEAANTLYMAKFYWNFLSDADRDYCHVAQHAIEEQEKWNV